MGRAWPVLSGERGEYDVTAGQPDAAKRALAIMAGAANDGDQIPEQVGDQPDAHGFTFGKGTDSAAPLMWAMAQFVRLGAAIDAGHDVEPPSVVADRYTRTERARGK